MAKKIRVPKDGPVWHKSAEEATLDKMPKFNGHACGTGPHSDSKYNRAKQKRSWQREIDWQGARTRGPLPFVRSLAAVGFREGRSSVGNFRPISIGSLSKNRHSYLSESGGSVNDYEIRGGLARDRR